MSSKLPFLCSLSCFLLALPFNEVAAQKKSRAEVGKLFLSTTAPSTGVAARDITTDIEAAATAPISRSANRTINGTANNLLPSRNNWGAAEMPLFREMPSAYGASNPNNAMNGANRPSARKISNVVSDEPVTIFNARNLSTFIYIWGQFIDHDFALTPTVQSPIPLDESVPIILPADETVFTENIPFNRSGEHPGTGRTTPREQTNSATSWLDGSGVYGSDQPRANWLRTFRGGKMKTSAGNLLPWNTVTGQKSAAIDPNAPSMANDGGKTIKTFVAGDIRAAEHPDLTTMHILFVREHNRFCDILARRGMTNDEQMYQLARKKVGGMIQAITYNEFLPALGINVRPMSGYNPNARPDITNIFATAGYRLGHTMVADEVLLFDNNCKPLDPEALDLIEIFWNPSVVERFNVEPFFKGSAAHTQYETNMKINDILRNFLFNSPSDPVRFGIDLAALNIQRGRDHGLPDYNSVRKFYTGSAATSFRDITSDPVEQENLRSLYGNVNNIDLWTGVLAEDLVGGTSVGKTVQAILRVQFENLRNGDFYFFEWDPFLPTEDRNDVRNSHLSDLMKRNSRVTNIQSNVFFVEACPGFTSTPARAIPTTNISETSSDASVNVYPNPAINNLTINLRGQNAATIIRVFASNGKLVKTISTKATDTSIQVNTTGFAKGLYLINISSGKATKQMKFIKL